MISANPHPRRSQPPRLELPQPTLTGLTVATILLTAAADSSSPLGCSTSVMPRYLRLKSIPSSSVSRVSVQFSGSSGQRRTGPQTLMGRASVCSPHLLGRPSKGHRGPPSIIIFLFNEGLTFSSISQAPW